MSSGAQFVVAAYAVILFVLIMYMVVVGMKSARIGREVELLSRMLDQPDSDHDSPEGVEMPPDPDVSEAARS